MKPHSWIQSLKSGFGAAMFETFVKTRLRTVKVGEGWGGRIPPDPAIKIHPTRLELGNFHRHVRISAKKVAKH